MEYTEKFKFLKYDVIEKKDKTAIFLKVHCLDTNGNLYKFFVVNEDTIKKIAEAKFIVLQDVTVNFTVTQREDLWNVNLNDINPVPAGKN